MHFEVSHEELSAGLTRIASVPATKTTIAAAKCLLLRTEDNMLSITATDFNNGMVEYLPVTVKKKGAVCVDAKMFTTIVKGAGKKELIIRCNEDLRVEIKSGLNCGSV